MKQGPPLTSATTDCGAICMGRKQMQHYQKLVDDAVSKGAKVLSGEINTDFKVAQKSFVFWTIWRCNASTHGVNESPV